HWKFLLDPAAQLFAQFVDLVGSETAASVDRQSVSYLTEEPDERKFQESSFQIPKRRVDCRNRHRTNAGASEIADRTHHRSPAILNRHRVSTNHDLFQMIIDQFCSRNVGVGVTKSGFAAG